MIKCSAALKTYLASQDAVTCRCWLAKQKNDAIVGFTDNGRDVRFNLQAWMTSVSLSIIPAVAATGSVVYRATQGFSATDVASNADLSVANMEARGPLLLPALDEVDVAAGVWDACQITLFLVNPNDLTMGALIYRCGTIGEITVDRGVFTAELLGTSLAYQTVLGRLTSPLCPYNLGDAECKVDLNGGSPAWKVTGALTAVSADGLTLYDTSRTEPGPTGGVQVVGVTKANPGVVSLYEALGLPDGASVSITGVLGMTQINIVVVIADPNDTLFTFKLPIDTTTFPAYAGGGLVTPLGSDSGWFDGGVITFTSGLNTGLSMEVQAYNIGQMLLELPMPYAVQAGDAYTMTPGCNKIMLSDCKLKFNNVINFGGEPWLPGTDKLIQVGLTA